MTRSARTAEDARRRADALEEDGDFEGAIAAISEAVDLERQNPKYHALRGRLFHLREHWPEAIRDFDSALALKPDAPTTLYFRARSKSMVNDLDGAIRDFEHCIELQPTSADAYAEIGHIKYFRGNLLQARDAYKKALSLDPERYSDVKDLVGEIEQKLKRAT